MDSIEENSTPPNHSVPERTSEEVTNTSTVTTVNPVVERQTETTPLSGHPTTRSSTRLAGKIPNYKGMTAKAGDSPVEVIEISALSLQFDCLPSCFNTSLIDLSSSKSFVKATRGPEGEKWLQACNKEIQSMIDKEVWQLVPRPQNTNIIRGLWLFRKKPKADGYSLNHKACFVAMGNTQKAGEDYSETFAPTGKPTSLRLLIAIASINGWKIHQMDGVAAFLSGILNEEIYVEHPEGFVESGSEGRVCKLLRSLYGLKQSPKIWQDDVCEFLIEIRFTKCELDHCTYIKHDKTENLFTAIYVHVDDMAITGNDILNFKKLISNKWDMDDLGLAKLVVGIEISRPMTP